MMFRILPNRISDWLVMAGLLIFASSALLTLRDLERIFSQQPLSENIALPTATALPETPPRTNARDRLPISSGHLEQASPSQMILPAASSTLPEKLERPKANLPSLEKPPRAPQVPLELRIAAINLVAPIKLTESRFVEIEGKKFQDWLVPDEYAAGWHSGSARLGETGNLVLNGHNNIYGAVFASLVDLQPGDEILVISEDMIYPYQVANKMILPEKQQGVDVRMSNAAWLQPSDDERLTLITCWPWDSNTHRLIIAARPSEENSPHPISSTSGEHGPGL